MLIQSFEQEVGTAIAGMATTKKRQDGVPDDHHDKGGRTRDPRLAWGQAFEQRWEN